MSDADGDLVEIESQLLDIVAQEGMIDRGRLNKDAVLLDLDIQSADYVMILMAIEEKWGVYLPVDEDLTEAKTVGDLVELVKGKIVEHKAEESHSLKRVVITGTGAISACGIGAEALWTAARNGRSGVRQTLFPTLKRQVILEAAPISGADYQIALSTTNPRFQDRVSAIAQVAAGEAIDQAGLGIGDFGERCAVSIGAGFWRRPDHGRKLSPSFSRGGQSENRSDVCSQDHDQCASFMDCDEVGHQGAQLLHFDILLFRIPIDWLGRDACGIRDS